MEKSKQAKLNALMDLKSKMMEMGGESLINSLGRDKEESEEEMGECEGPMMGAKVMARSREGLEEGLEKAKEIIEQQESSDEYENMSKEDLIRLLKNK